MIKLFPMPDNTSKLVPIYPAETPETINHRLMLQTNQNFKIELQETQTGRILPDDELLIDGREYYIIYDRLPWQ